jgi:hypothetical protein
VLVFFRCIGCDLLEQGVTATAWVGRKALSPLYGRSLDWRGRQGLLEPAKYPHKESGQWAVDWS